MRLGELLKLQKLYFGHSEESARLPIDAVLAKELQILLQRLGHYTGDISGVWDEPSRDAFWVLVGIENLEERWAPDETPELLDPVILDFLRERYT